MKKNILKSLEPQTRSLFRFKNSDSKPKFSGDQNAGTTVNSDPTITVTTVVTL